MAVKSSLSSPSQSASYLAASSPPSGDWLFALPVASCGLRLDDEAVRTAVALRLDLPLCAPHPCCCSSLVDAHGLHSFACKRTPARSARHQAMDDLINRAFASVGIPVTKNLKVCHSHGKRPDLMLIRRQAGKTLTHHSRLPINRFIHPYGDAGYWHGS